MAVSDGRVWALLEQVAALERPPGSVGEARAAAVVAAELGACGSRTRIEAERVHGTYWIPLGLASAAGMIAAGLPRRSGTLLAALSCASAADDLSIGTRRLRRVLGRRVARNVVSEFGPADAESTLVVHAHHDAARTGLAFHPAGAKAAAVLAGGLMERIGGTPAPMWGAAVGPAAVALGRVMGLRGLRYFGAAVSGAYAAAMADIWRSPAVPGANDNLSGVGALLSLAGQDFHATRPRSCALRMLVRRS